MIDMNKKITFSLVVLCSLFFFGELTAQQSNIWSAEKANNWYKNQGWLVGANFLPSNAINQLEMFQADTFDPATIDRELSWAAAIGMNTMRVYLHDLAWKADAAGFKKRMDEFLSIAEKNKIKILFTIFDDCWNPDAAIGLQPAPKPGIHNSGWVRSPNKATHNDATDWKYLEAYVNDILGSFKNDKRIVMWDLYNEPGNSDYGLSSMPLLKKVFEWAWAVRPNQPITAAAWGSNKQIDEYLLKNSDVITIHNYSGAANLEKELQQRLKLGRPVICSEYMARTRGSKFQTHLPIFKKYNVGAINWGLVAGKSNTIYQWDTPMPDGREPKIWFHDVFRKDGSAYDSAETEVIKSLTATK
jgi:hypothetical protein